MRSHALKKKAFLATAAAAGITMVFPVLCAASENDRHIPIQILPWILWYQKHFIPQETI